MLDPLLGGERGHGVPGVLAAFDMFVPCSCSSFLIALRVFFYMTVDYSSVQRLSRVNLTNLFFREVVHRVLVCSPCFVCSFIAGTWSKEPPESERRQQQREQKESNANDKDHNDISCSP